MASKYWLKLYHEMIDDPKVARLPDSSYRRFIECLLLAGETDDGGYLPPLPDMAWRIRVDETTLQQDLSRLALAGMVELKENDRWFVTKFAERQAPSDAAERMREYRKRKRKVAKEKEKREDTDTDTDTYRAVTDVTKRNAPAQNAFWAIPKNLEQKEFLTLWRQWLTHVDEARLTFTETQAAIKLAELSDAGLPLAIASIKMSFSKGWKNIHVIDPAANGNGRYSQTPAPAEQRIPGPQ